MFSGIFHFMDKLKNVLIFVSLLIYNIKWKDIKLGFFIAMDGGGGREVGRTGL